MKGVRCSWVDMQKIRAALSAGRRGNQAHLEHMRCVDQSTVSTWKAACEVMDALDGKHDICHVSHFQPSHAREIARAYRKREKDPAKWTEEIKEEIAEWVDRCEAEEMTVPQLRQALLCSRTQPKGEEPGCTVSDLDKLADKAADDSGERFGAIYADPPWRYGNQATRAATDDHYPTMSVEEIAALPVADLAADDAHLHLWATNAFLPHAFRVIEAWGFEYKSLFVWCKPEMGLGNYWRVCHELLLLGVRGNCPFRNKTLRSWKEITRKGKHSEKPEQVRHMIEKASPGPYLELFGREAVNGWKVWGNQIGRDLFTQHLEAV